jgi:hypothetical protein
MKNTKIVLSAAAFLGILALTADAAATGEIQQQLDSVSSTIDTIGAQAESLKQKGIFRTIWDNISAAVIAIWSQITGMLSQIGSVFSALAN